MVHRSLAPRNRTTALLLTLAGALAMFARCEAARAPDTIFFGTFVTLVASPSEAEALAVTDGVIVGAGSRAEIEPMAGPSTAVVEIEGVAVPGFVDGHVHVSGFGALLKQLNVQAMPKETVLDAVAKAASATPAGEWITGGGWDEGFFAIETYPRASDLDAVSPDHPVSVVAR